MRFKDVVEEAGVFPLGWAGATAAMDYLNWGDAMSPVMVALLSGRTIARVPFKSVRPRMAAVGTIAHGFSGGAVWVWGSGCSPTPKSPQGGVAPYHPPANTTLHLCATRGPMTASLLRGGQPGDDIAHGDPVWLLPDFYRPHVPKTHELGVILHLSELADRSFVARPRGDIAAYTIEAGDAAIKLITTVTPIGVEPLRAWIDTVLSCKRIVSTSLHGMVVAESYGIPCLPFSHFGGTGPTRVDLDDPGPLDPRLIDLYRGLGMRTLTTFDRSHDRPLDWQALINAIDRHWSAKTLDSARLLEAFPLDLNPIAAPEGKTVFDHPTLQGLSLQHDVSTLLAQEKRFVTSKKTA